MSFLPKGQPVQDDLRADSTDVPAILLRLRSEGFTGYVGFVFQGAEGILLLDQGRMLLAHFRKGHATMSGVEALEAIFGSIVSLGGTLGIYKLSRSLAALLPGVLIGDVVWRDKELRYLDMTSIIGRLKDRGFSGTIRISSGDRTGLIFFRDGSPLGFFHEGEVDISVTFSGDQKVPRLPEAKVDIFSAKTTRQAHQPDLLESGAVDDCWKKLVRVP